MNLPDQQSYETRVNPPAFNLPTVLSIYLVLLIAIHAIRVWFISSEFDHQLILLMSFIPARFSNVALDAIAPLAKYWSILTYSLLHGDWGHLLMNVIWMAAFGSAVAKRISTVKFILFCSATAIGGAAAHFLAHPNELVPIIGASATVSGAMGAAARFAFARTSHHGDLSQSPALSLAQTFQNQRVLTFLGLWFGLNFLFGSGLIPAFGDGQLIAWEAHIGGFIVGILSFSWFDQPS